MIPPPLSMSKTHSIRLRRIVAPMEMVFKMGTFGAMKEVVR